MADRPDYDEILGRYQSYLSGEPLNDELAAIRQGKVVLMENRDPVAHPQTGAIEDAERPLSRAERLELKEMRLSDGWPVLMRLLQKRFQTLRKAAINMSQNDPLGNAGEIGKSWAYVTLYQRAKIDMETLLDEELKALMEEEQ